VSSKLSIEGSPHAENPAQKFHYTAVINRSPTMTFNYETITTQLTEGVLTATLHNPPCNVMTLQMSLDLADFVDSLASFEDARVLVLESATDTDISHGYPRTA
jgi:hypothetical protein